MAVKRHSRSRRAVPRDTGGKENRHPGKSGADATAGTGPDGSAGRTGEPVAFGTGDDKNPVHRPREVGNSKDRSPGRPPAGSSERVKGDLLQAARQLFLSYEFKAVSVRQIASLAGVNGAMVNYYFGGKKGLYLAMVDDVFNALEQPLRELHGQRHDSVRDFVRAYMQFLAVNPWWPNFVVREVLFGEDESRNSIIDKFSTTFVHRLISAIGNEIDTKRYRSNLSPELASWSLMGMMVFPFLSRPIAGHLLESELDGKVMADLIEHTGELFEQGVLPREEN